VTRFAYPGWPKWLYLFILIPHTILAMVTVPLVFMTVIPALRQRWDRHRRIAAWTWPVWLYVSVTGVLVYMMLYVWFPAPKA
jgi:putative membrane protein